MAEKESVTLKDTVPGFIEHLRALGKKKGTVHSYGKDMELAVNFFGEDKRVSAILPVHVSKFFASDYVNKKPNGAEKAELTIEKTKRVFRQFLVWAHEQGTIQDIPLPKSEKAKLAGKEDKGDKSGKEESAPTDQE